MILTGYFQKINAVKRIRCAKIIKVNTGSNFGIVHAAFST